MIFSRKTSIPKARNNDTTEPSNAVETNPKISVIFISLNAVVNTTQYIDNQM